MFRRALVGALYCFSPILMTAVNAGGGPPSTLAFPNCGSCSYGARQFRRNTDFIERSHQSDNCRFTSRALFCSRDYAGDGLATY